MNELEMIKKHYSSILPFIENACYNQKQDITEYFGKEIMMIHSGYGGYGWNKRTLIGVFENEYHKVYFEIRAAGNGSYLLDADDWYCNVILPENFEKMKDVIGNAPTIVPNKI